VVNKKVDNHLIVFMGAYSFRRMIDDIIKKITRISSED
jgi:hypothetical protein